MQSWQLNKKAKTQLPPLRHQEQKQGTANDPGTEHHKEGQEDHLGPGSHSPPRHLPQGGSKGTCYLSFSTDAAGADLQPPVTAIIKTSKNMEIICFIVLSVLSYTDI